jgi:hypothetical protein
MAADLLQFLAVAVPGGQVEANDGGEPVMTISAPQHVPTPGGVPKAVAQGVPHEELVPILHPPLFCESWFPISSPLLSYLSLWLQKSAHAAIELKILSFC